MSWAGLLAGAAGFVLALFGPWETGFERTPALAVLFLLWLVALLFSWLDRLPPQNVAALLALSTFLSALFWPVLRLLGSAPAAAFSLSLFAALLLLASRETAEYLTRRIRSPNRGLFIAASLGAVALLLLSLSGLPRLIAGSMLAYLAVGYVGTFPWFLRKSGRPARELPCGALVCAGMAGWLVRMNQAG